MKKLPIGKKDFKILIEDNCIYVDKTEYLYKMISEGYYYFLSRPRRFGKSLFVSTLENIFKGNKELFKGLYIYDKWDFEEYPVIKIDFNDIERNEPEIFQKELCNVLKKIGQSYNITLTAERPKRLFSDLIKEMGKIKRVVILVDEYDKPIIDTLTNIEVCKKNREILKDFYGTIKALDEYIKFAVLTGVSKFSKTSIFSDLNNLQDITITAKYNALLGYEEKDLKQYFQDYLNLLCETENQSENIILEKIQQWYNGYNWSGEERLYNPFSVLNLFSVKKFSNYWFETGTPTFLVNIIYDKKYKLPNFENLILTSSTFGKFEIENIGVEALLFQTGYLTIKDIIHEKEKDFYKLYFPNKEVKDSLLDILFKKYIAKNNGDYDYKFSQMRKQLESDDIEGFIENIKIIFAGIPYDIFINKEDYYNSVVYTILAMVGITAQFEVMTNLGRLDCAIDFGSKVFIFEFKLDQPAELAINQIKTKKYPQKYDDKTAKIHLIGVEFSSQERNISNYITVKVQSNDS